MTEAFNHLNKVKCGESQLALIPHWGWGREGRQTALQAAAGEGWVPGRLPSSEFLAP